ncbi:Hypp5590 [Branchiostoma lanceolatum]|uniref:Hypp5590 protein n=1 Tax=Branchiostoma lanceolatum TaxID=7740 RepID=A0A8J9VQF9_BRALA|nr:Hypp5590 [Branchiostoma lanceolatum]
MLMVGYLLLFVAIQTSSGGDSATASSTTVPDSDEGGSTTAVDRGSLPNATVSSSSSSVKTSSNATTTMSHRSDERQNSGLTILRFYTVIVVLGISVLAGVILVVFGLFFKGEAFRKSADDRMKDNTREGFDRINSDLFLLGLSV